MKGMDKQVSSYKYIDSEVSDFMENNNKIKPTCWVAYIIVPLIVALVIYFISTVNFYNH